MKTEKCSKCGFEYEIGDWPMCPHGSVFGGRELHSNPTIVYKNAEGKCWFPTGDNAKPPAGFERHELRTVFERDKFEKEVGAKETAALRERIYRDREEWHRTWDHNRNGLEKAREELLAAGYKPELIEHIQENMRQREEAYNRALRSESGFHIEANHYYGTRHHDE